MTTNAGGGRITQAQVPDFDPHQFDQPFSPNKHRWILNATRVPPAELHAYLERELETYQRLTLSAGDDPRDGHLPPAYRRRIPHDGSDMIVQHMRVGIRLAVLAAEGHTQPVNVTIFGRRRKNTEDRPGDELTMSISVAAKPDPDLEPLNGGSEPTP
jgi:hypothetical protein